MIESTIEILKRHSMNAKLKNGRVWVMDCWVEPNGRSNYKWVDCTDWEMKKLMAWLGY